MPDPNLKQQWQLDEILRPLGLAELITNDLLLFAQFGIENMLSWSENMSALGPDGGSVLRAPWSASDLTFTNFYNPAVQAEIHEFTTATPGKGGVNPLWFSFEGDSALLSQDVEVAPGEIYTFSFFAQPVEGCEDATASVVNYDTLEDIIAPWNYGAQLVPGEFTRIHLTFRAPPDCNRVRVFALAGTVRFILAQSSVEWLEYAPRSPNRFEHSEPCLYVGGVAYPIAVTTIRER